MKTLLLALSFLALLVDGSRAAQPFTISLPEGFAGPETATLGSARLFAFTRSSVDPTVKTLFQVSIVPVPAEQKGDSLDKMLGVMLRGIERRRTEFKQSVHAKGKLAGVESISVDWEGVGEGHAMKGRMICAVSDGKLYCLHAQDSAAGWTKTLSEIDTALQTFAFTK